MRVAIVHNRDPSGVINVFGPQNRERYNPKTVERVAAALESGGHTVRVIDGNMHVIEQLRDFMPRVMTHERPGMVFNMAYGIQGVSRYTHLPAMLEMLGVPYVGSNPMAHGLALDKVIAKILFENAGLPTAKFWNFATADDEFDDLTFPVIVKPKMEAVSYGVQIVNDKKALQEAVAFLIEEFKQHVLVEQFIAGREFAIGLLGNGDPEVFPIVEIDLEGDPDAIQSADEKLRQPRAKICPADLSPKKTADLIAVAKRAFRSLDLYDFARVDLRMDKKGKPFILEINSMASLGMTGTYVYGAQTAGYTYESLVNRILDVAAVRYFGQDYAGGSTAATQPTAPAMPRSVSARVRSFLRSNTSTIEDNLRRMVDMRTPPQEVDHVNAFGEWLSGQMKQLGFKEDTYPGVNVGLVRYFTNHDGDTNDVLLLSHLDTASDDDHIAFREEGTRLYGTGSAESKGGIAVALAALRALRFARALSRVKCAFLVTTDETINGARSRPIVEELAPKSKHVIGLKAGDLDGGVVVSRSGRATYRIATEYGRTKRPPTPAKVLKHFFNRLMAVQRMTSAKAGVRVGITRVDVDATFGRLPKRAEAGISVRFEKRKGAEALERRVKAVAGEKPVAGMSLEVSGRIRRPPMERTRANDTFFAEVSEIANRLNSPVSAVHRPSSSDICFAPSSTPKIDGMGPLGAGERTREEYVLRNSLIDRAALLAMVIRYCATGATP